MNTLLSAFAPMLARVLDGDDPDRLAQDLSALHRMGVARLGEQPAEQLQFASWATVATCELLAGAAPLPAVAPPADFLASGWQQRLDRLTAASAAGDNDCDQAHLQLCCVQALAWRQRGPPELQAMLPALRQLLAASVGPPAGLPAAGAAGHLPLARWHWCLPPATAVGVLGAAYGLLLWQLACEAQTLLQRLQESG